MWRKWKIGVVKGVTRYERKDEWVRKERERDRKFGAHSLTGLLFISAYIQLPSNTYFDTRQLKKKEKKKRFALLAPAAHAGFGRKTGGATGKLAADVGIMWTVWLFRKWTPTFLAFLVAN